MDLGLNRHLTIINSVRKRITPMTNVLRAPAVGQLGIVFTLLIILCPLRFDLRHTQIFLRKNEKLCQLMPVTYYCLQRTQMVVSIL